MIHLPILLAPFGSAFLVAWWMQSVSRRGKLLNDASGLLENVTPIPTDGNYGPPQIVKHNTFDSSVSGTVYSQQVKFSLKQFPTDDMKLSIAIECPMRVRVELVTLSLLLPTIRVGSTDLRSGHLMWWQRLFHAQPNAAEAIENLFNQYGIMELELGVLSRDKSSKRFLTLTLPAPDADQLPLHYEDLLRDAIELTELFSQLSRRPELQSG